MCGYDVYVVNERLSIGLTLFEFYCNLVITIAEFIIQNYFCVACMPAQIYILYVCDKTFLYKSMNKIDQFCVCVCMQIKKRVIVHVMEES